MRRIVLFTLLLLVTSVTAQAKTAYRFAAICEEGVCLLGADGKSKLVLAKDTKARSWTGLTVSPSGRMIAVASESVDKPDDDYSMDPSYLYRIDPHTGKTERVPCKIEHPGIPENPVWLDDQTVLLETFDEKKVEVSVYADNILTGKSRLVVPPREDEWTYAQLLPSPSRKLLATEFGVTEGTWLSVTDLNTGRRHWRTNPNNGFAGFTTMAWSPDSKSLLVSRHTGDEEFGLAPGGLWKYDALTGKQKVWKYPGKNVWGVWASPDGNTLAVNVGNELEFLDAASGNLLFKAKFSGAIGVFISNDEFACSSSRISIINIPNRRVRSIPHSVSGGRIITSPSVTAGGVPVRTGICNGSQLLDLHTSERIRFTDKSLEYLTWLPKDIVR